MISAATLLRSRAAENQAQLLQCVSAFRGSFECAAAKKSVLTETESTEGFFWLLSKGAVEKIKVSEGYFKCKHEK